MAGKLETKELARARTMLSTVLFYKLLGRGYLELGPDKKRRLTEKGKEVGGELSPGSTSLFLWPPDLEV
jgi:hypothetical protein